MFLKTKKDIRKEMLRLREVMSKEETTKKSLAIVNQAIQLPSVQSARGVLLFYPFRGEPKIDFFLSYLDKDYFFPIVVGKDLQPACHTSETVLNSYGIREPRGSTMVDWGRIDVVFVPALSIDYKGNRLGYGKGYYDNFFKRLFHYGLDPLKLGIIYSFQLIEKIPTSSHDVPLEGCITENETLIFKRST